MSKILSLAQDFEKKSKQQAHDTEQRLKSEFERHERSIEQALRSSEQRIESDIHDHKKRMSALLLNSWTFIVVVSVLVLMGVLSGVIVWQSKLITQNQKELISQEITLENLNSQTWGLTIFEDKGDRYIQLPRGHTMEREWLINGQYEIFKLVEE